MIIIEKMVIKYVWWRNCDAGKILWYSSEEVLIFITFSSLWVLAAFFRQISKLFFLKNRPFSLELRPYKLQFSEFEH